MTAGQITTLFWALVGASILAVIVARDGVAAAVGVVFLILALQILIRVVDLLAYRASKRIAARRQRRLTAQLGSDRDARGDVWWVIGR